MIYLVMWILFFSLQVLNHMFNNHADHRIHPCWGCGQIFTGLSSFAAHVGSNLLSVICCPHCSAKHVERKAILKHMAASHPTMGRAITLRSILICKERELHGWWFAPSLKKLQASGKKIMLMIYAEVSNATNLCSMAMILGPKYATT